MYPFDRCLLLGRNVHHRGTWWDRFPILIPLFASKKIE